ncbi:MAG: anti-sigma factor family protein [Limisphaerales bacterium]
MKNDVFLSQLRESGWRRKLTETELAGLRAHLAAHPEARADWEMESALNAALSGLPDAPVPSNFTARVLQAVDREAARPRGWSWNWHGLVPRVAFAAVVLAFTGLALHHHEMYSQRVALVRSVALVTGGQPLPSPEALENFDAIRRMSRPQHADDELLALMQ